MPRLDLGLDKTPFKLKEEKGFPKSTVKNRLDFEESKEEVEINVERMLALN